jgi:hypothetical protein
MECEFFTSTIVIIRKLRLPSDSSVVLFFLVKSSVHYSGVALEPYNPTLVKFCLIGAIAIYRTPG